jgi:hypothetical protein
MRPAVDSTIDWQDPRARTAGQSSLVARTAMEDQRASTRRAALVGEDDHGHGAPLWSSNSPKAQPVFHPGPTADEKPAGEVARWLSSVDRGWEDQAARSATAMICTSCQADPVA